MTKIKTLDDLKRRQDEVRDKIELRNKAENPDKIIQVRVSMGTCGIAAGAKNVMEYFVRELPLRHIDAVVTQMECTGHCYAEPIVEIILPEHDPIVFGLVNCEKADEIIERFILRGELVHGIMPKNGLNLQP